DDHDIRIRVVSLRVGRYAQIDGVDNTRTFQQLVAEQSDEIPHDLRVPRRRSRHREHLAVDVLTLPLRVALDAQVLLRAQARGRIRAHVGIRVIQFDDAVAVTAWGRGSAQLGSRCGNAGRRG